MKITIRKFSKNGCRPCLILANYIGEIDLSAHDAELIEVNIDNQPEAVDQYGLNSVPVLSFERNGVEIIRLTGLRPTEEIIEAIELAKVQR